MSRPKFVNITGGKVPDEMTVKELIDILNNFDSKQKVIMSYDPNVGCEDGFPTVVQLKVKGYSKEVALMETTINIGDTYDKEKGRLKNMRSYHIYYSSNGKVIHHIVHDEEERKEVVYSLTHCNDPGIKFIGCLITYLIYYYN